LEVDILREEVTVPFAARVTVPGLKLQVPKGKKPLLMQVRNTLPANPFTEVTVTVELAPCPGATLAEELDKLKLKS